MMVMQAELESTAHRVDELDAVLGSRNHEIKVTSFFCII